MRMGGPLTMTASPFEPKKHSVERCQHEDLSGVDGAGSYFAQWLVVKSESVRTVLSTDEEPLEGS